MTANVYIIDSSSLIELRAYLDRLWFYILVRLILVEDAVITETVSTRDDVWDWL